ncbi:TPA: Rgg/GadR/MutR family transcriptional regulator [Streptococcus equi subsp. zooepidemicus]|uniref:helix-turn-helix domain-containing protein n=1 Tax=Streptococcus equi TaxID=1336 RepID=UPI001E516D4B|nr:Rgg/GadR/MutR family transcriptional regulator [Streptococcus equi]MCD3369936.1 Rgg/GadR/MutR family transcriptional regulator [Streptococcus equi subsp. zooepidemicus]MCD3374621.1 Rgg/GadR/MutR family transcriptional regulator [Streptococcus equi subsp. zooepidemicus]MCD3380315.1 Rgg/GadR/MutR family transcriptional regulator [Streptococcus equi subsp. zooepidemicus]MDI5953322.1 Rgg/GadR/MutR family transcriptional regulator [Streptococcus equi subsp. zooepidemicus]MDI6075119.1 Rgg/GadR/Mu
MNNTDLMSLGELYKELRIARGLRLKDVARDNLSVSQLSKFENGQSMLAADKLLLAISGIHMTFAEFGHAVNGYKVSDFFQLGIKVAELQTASDIDGLKELLSQYKGDDIFSVYNRLNELIIKSAVYSLDPNVKIEESDKQLLTEYLYSIEEWTEYELYIFGGCLAILSDEDMIFLGKAFIERDKIFLSLPQHRKAAHITLLNIIMTLLERRQLFYVDFFIKKLEELIIYQDMFTIVSLNFFKKIHTYLSEESSHKSDIEDYINLVKQLGNPQFVQILHRTLSVILDS